MNPGKAITFEVTPKDLAKILARCSVDKETNCWIFEGATDQKGYAQARVENHPSPVRLSRVIRHFFRRDLNASKTVHHVDACRNPACINPDHLRPLGLVANTRDGNHARRVKTLAKLLSVAIGKLSAREALANDRDYSAMSLIAHSRKFVRRLPKQLRPQKRRVTHEQGQLGA